jgi:hypothetical protein
LPGIVKHLDWWKIERRIEGKIIRLKRKETSKGGRLEKKKR